LCVSFDTSLNFILYRDIQEHTWEGLEAGHEYTLEIEVIYADATSEKVSRKQTTREYMSNHSGLKKYIKFLRTNACLISLGKFHLKQWYHTVLECGSE
jgi:hypothetical protein